MLYMQPFPDIKCLELENPTEICSCDVVEVREEYALRALLLFLPFRKKEDLMGKSQSYWEQLQHAISDHLLHKDAIEILQNIQDRHNCSESKNVETK